jgi:hypothetical protein
MRSAVDVIADTERFGQAAQLAEDRGTPSQTTLAGRNAPRTT